MGKRKERRLGAASNRRVKLDLLPQPSGDFGDSTNQEEVGGGGNAQSHAESPNSPSSSDQRPGNPLLLLGQYSDEELEEESGKEINQNTRENSPAELDEQQVKINKLDGLGKEVDESLIAEKVAQEKDDSSSSGVPKLEENCVLDDGKTECPHRDADAVHQASAPWTSDIQTTGDVDSGWKMVLHEESNSYYYWNVVTGETSWEVPAVLTQGNESTYNPTVPEVEEIHVTSVDTQHNRSTNDMIAEATEVDNSLPELEGHTEKYPDIIENDKNEGGHFNTIDGVNYLSAHEGFASHYYDALSNGDAHNTNSSIQDMSGHVYQPTVDDSSSDSFRLLQLGESLSERLKSLKGAEGFSDQITKLMFELDIRLADIKSLVPYGSSLLPFWLHSENQLKKLETAVNNEVLKHSQIAKVCESNEAENKSQENVCETSLNEKNPTSTSSVFDGSDHTTISKEVVEANETEISLDNVSNVLPRSEEDVDMDVEMEVEVELGVHDGPDHIIPPIPHEQHDARESEEEFDIPQPPNEEWIPPPPPDDEPLPPPPPDEPSDAAFPLPQSELQTAQPYTYGEQYSYTYPESGFEYYGQTNSLTTEVPGNSYYVDANGCQVAAPLPTLYYAAVPNPYPDSTLVMTPSEPATYYTLQNGIPSDRTEQSTEVPSISTSTVKRNASVVSAPAVASSVSAPTEPVSKVQPKVTRTKKRTVATVPSLRSNKKVSGLVDKWKAVKEELHEDEEDEPENAYEVLEKKRQREIEQWLAQQVASGEAKDNANFQPLGGDWRERVRRKRAKKSTEAEEKVAKASDDTSKQPDLVELTKQLPTGWQAYWDEGSKLVYYANAAKSETTWTKPTS